MRSVLNWPEQKKKNKYNNPIAIKRRYGRANFVFFVFGLNITINRRL